MSPSSTTAYSATAASASNSSGTTQSVRKCMWPLAPQDVIIYKLFPLLTDGDAMDLFETCKYLYYTYTWHYRIKNEINLTTLYTRPAYCSASGRIASQPRPKIIRGVILKDYDFVKIADRLLWNRYDGRRVVKKPKVSRESCTKRKLKVWEAVCQEYSNNNDSDVESDEGTDDYLQLGRYNFQIFPQTEFESIEELVLQLACKWMKTPYWPPNLKKLRYHCMFNKEKLILESGIFPPKLEHLEIFNARILLKPGAFPAGLKTFKISNCILHITDLGSMDNYPSSLEHFSIDMIDPALDYLEESDDPDDSDDPDGPDVAKKHNLSMYIPSTLKTLSLTHFDYPLAGQLSATLIDLTLLSCPPLRVGDLPNGLRRLKIQDISSSTGRSETLVPGLLPSSLQYAVFENLTNRVLGPNILPEGLLHFEVEFGEFELEIGSLPSSLQVLSLPNCKRSFSTMKDLFATLPNLHRLEIFHLLPSNEISEETIPSSVKSIKIEQSTVDALRNYQSLSSLKIDRLEFVDIAGMDRDVPFLLDMLPKTLKELHIGHFHYRYTPHFAPGTLPDTLEKLELYDYHHPFGPGVLPSSLRSLTLSIDYDFPLTELPPTLHYLYFIVKPSTIGDDYPAMAPTHPFVCIPASRMPPHLQIQFTQPEQSRGYPLYRDECIEPDLYSRRYPRLQIPTEQPNKKRKASDDS